MENLYMIADHTAAFAVDHNVDYKLEGLKALDSVDKRKVAVNAAKNT